MSGQFPVLLLLIEQKVAKAAGLTIREVRDGGRKLPMVKARHAVWFAASKFLGMTASHIAELYDKDHTTVLSALDKIANSSDAAALEEGLRTSAPEVFMPRRERIEQGAVSSWDFGADGPKDEKQYVDKSHLRGSTKPPEVE